MIKDRSIDMNIIERIKNILEEMDISYEINKDSAAIDFMTPSCEEIVIEVEYFENAEDFVSQIEGYVDDYKEGYKRERDNVADKELFETTSKETIEILEKLINNLKSEI